MTDTKLDELMNLRDKIKHAESLVILLKSSEAIGTIQYYGGDELAKEFLEAAEYRAKTILDDVKKTFSEA